jgi:scyllo-inositol 2-dehydrogenase (NADP+)
MRIVVVGLGTQGRKRMTVAGGDVVATVDPIAADARYQSIDQVPLESFDAALVCTPDQAKIELMSYLISNGKHVLVEKPLLASSTAQLASLTESIQTSGVACYTAYNHRFEPNVLALNELLEAGTLGDVYLTRFFYGNGTALDVKGSPWRDHGLGVISDLGSHLLDLTRMLFGETGANFELRSAHQFETRCYDHALMVSDGNPVVELEMTFLSWRNTFTVDVFGSLGSAHIDCLCKWGPSRFTVRQRVFPSGVPGETVKTIESLDPTWAAEYEHFKHLCQSGGTNIENDQWINSVLEEISLAQRSEVVS